MDNIIEIVFAVIVFLFAAFAFVRKNLEGQDIEKRKGESDWTAEELPEETRRMLFGDTATPVAKPAQPKRNPDPFVQVRDIFNELRRQIEPQTAKPRQGAPRPQPPTIPPQVSQAPRQPHPLQPQFRPAQQQQPPRPATPTRPPSPSRPVITSHPVAPPRPAPRPQPPRMVPQQSQGAAPRQVSVQQQRPAPLQRRQQQRPLVSVVEEEEGPHMPLPTQKKPRAKAARQHSRWLSNHNDLRRGIILSEILGPPRAMRDFAE
jgi:hypothetical protein